MTDPFAILLFLANNPLLMILAVSITSLILAAKA